VVNYGVLGRYKTFFSGVGTLTILIKLLKQCYSQFHSHYRVQRLLRHIRPFMPARPRWEKLLAEQPFLHFNSTSPKILFATGTGSHWSMSGFESVLAAALKIRGAEIKVLLCDGILPACQECDLRLFPKARLLKEGAQPLCGTCFKPAKKMFAELDVSVISYSEWLIKEDEIEIEEVLKKVHDNDLSKIIWRGIAVGEHAVAGTLRFFGRGDIVGEVHGKSILRQYLRASLITTAILQRLLTTHHFDRVVFHHGIYVPQGIVGDVCRQFGVAVVNWHPAYRDRSYIFSHDDTYHKTMIDEPCQIWENIDLDANKEQQVMTYLESRREGGNDWITFQRHNNFLFTQIQELNLDFSRPIIGLLTNVMWDAQLHFRHNAFNSILEWLLFTVEYFIQRRDLQLLIRIHPAEILGSVPSRQRAVDEIHARFPKLPANICIVNADTPINTYALMQHCDTVLVYGTKMAIELPCWGIPVIVAGEAWARGKGFTIDATSPNEFRQMLDALPHGVLLDEKRVKRARQYAYHLFHRRMIPVDFARRFKHFVPFAYDFSSMNALLPTVDKGLDVICNGILYGKPFIYDENG